MNQSGFSLLELAIAMLILALISVFGLIGWNQFWQRQSLLWQTETTLVHLQNIKKQSILTNQTWIIQIEKTPQGSCLRFEEDQTCFLELQNINAQLEKSAPSIIFYGERATSQSLTLSLQNAYGETRLIIASMNRIRACFVGQTLSSLGAC